MEDYSIKNIAKYINETDNEEKRYVYLHAFHMACISASIDTIEYIVSKCEKIYDNFIDTYVDELTDATSDNNLDITDFISDKHLHVFQWLIKNIKNNNKINNFLDVSQIYTNFNILKYILDHNTLNNLDCVVDKYYFLLKTKHINCTKYVYDFLKEKRIINCPYDIENKYSISLESAKWLAEYFYNDTDKNKYFLSLLEYLLNSSENIEENIEEYILFVVTQISCELNIDNYFYTITDERKLHIINEIKIKYNLDISLKHDNIKNIAWFFENKLKTQISVSVEYIIDRLICDIVNTTKNNEAYKYKLIKIAYNNFSIIQKYFVEKMKNVTNVDICKYFTCVCIDCEDEIQILYTMLKNIDHFDISQVNITQILCNKISKSNQSAKYFLDFCINNHLEKYIISYAKHDHDINIFYEVCKKSCICIAEYLVRRDKSFKYKSIDGVIKTATIPSISKYTNKNIVTEYLFQKKQLFCVDDDPIELF